MKIKSLFLILLIFLIISCSSIETEKTLILFPMPNDRNVNYEINEDTAIENNPLYSIKNASKPLFHSNDNTINVFEVMDISKSNENEKKYVDSLFEKEDEYKGLNIKRTKLANKPSIHLSFVLDSIFDKNNNHIFEKSEYENAKKIKVRLGHYEDFNERENATGIISMSYNGGNYKKEQNNFLENKDFLDTIPSIKPYLTDIYIKDNFSNLISKENYYNNKQLKIKSLGNAINDSYKDRYYTISVNKIFAKMSKEMQKAARSEVIFAKNMTNFKVLGNEKRNLIERTAKNTYTTSNGIKYFEVQKANLNNPKPLFLRANTVVHEGFIKNRNDNNLISGSSMSAPYIARLAHDLKEKYPFLSYHQIKEIILTTADRDDSGYLSNIAGWGIVNKERALKGFSNFNAGLIEETKFFHGMYDKIYDENENIYQYINIPDNEEYEFSNDIDSGLSGNGNHKGSYFFEIYDDKNTKYEHQIPVVLDSEKNFYKNIKQAGLRKDGLGTLILSGIQKYDAKSQIINGRLILKNDSNSDYEIFNKGILTLENDNNKEINLKNILNDGILDFKTNSNLKNYTATENSLTKIKPGIIIKSDNFISLGNIKIETISDDILDDGKLKNIIINGNIDISKVNVSNIFLSKPILNGKYIEFKEELTNKKLNSLSEEEKRNLPSYDVNNKRFFEKYRISEIDKPILSNLLNLSTSNIDDKDEIKNEIFTDTYSSMITNTLENDLIIKSEKMDLFLSKMKNNNRIFNTNLISSNVFNDKKYSPFKNRLIFNSLSYERKLNDRLSTFISISNYMNKIDFKNNTNFNVNNYSASLGIKYIDEKYLFSNIFEFSIINGKSIRKLNEEYIKNNIKIFKINNDFNLGYIFNINEKNNMKINTNFLIQSLHINENKEENKLGVNILKNDIIKYSLGLNLNLNSKINDKLTFSNSIFTSVYLNDKTDLKLKILNKETTFKGKELNKYYLNYKATLKYTNDNLSFLSNIGLDSNKKSNISFNIIFEF